MGAYDLEGTNVKLELLTPETWEACADFVAAENLARASLVYGPAFNLTLGFEEIHRLIQPAGTGRALRLYLVREQDGPVVGVTGLADIDWVQRRGSLILLLGDEAIRGKRCYEPLKLLLQKAFGEWEMRRVTALVSCSELPTITVLKGFGFQQEGVLRRYIVFRGEDCDVAVFGVLRNEFRHVEE